MWQGNGHDTGPLTYLTNSHRLLRLTNDHRMGVEELRDITLQPRALDLLWEGGSADLQTLSQKSRESQPAFSSPIPICSWLSRRRRGDLVPAYCSP